MIYELSVELDCIKVACNICVSLGACKCSVQLCAVCQMFCAVESAECLAGLEAAKSSVSCYEQSFGM